MKGEYMGALMRGINVKKTKEINDALAVEDIPVFLSRQPLLREQRGRTTNSENGCPANPAGLVTRKGC